MAVGGEDDKVVLRSVETFDPNTLTWKPLACLPFAISKHGLVSVGKNLSRLNRVNIYSQFVKKDQITIRSIISQ